jgi:choice-of-anchor C domain-containing protein
MYTRSLILSFLLVVSAMSCRDSGLESNSSYPLSPSLGQMTLRFEQAPSEIVQVIATLSRQAYADMVLSLAITDTGASGTIQNVPIGVWHLSVIAYDQDRVARYAGETDVNVQPGNTTTVDLQLNPATGSIQINVTWGTPPNQGGFVNSSFERGPWVGTYLPLDSGSVAIPGWRVSRGGIDLTVYWQSYDGNRSIDLDGTPGPGGIEQTIRTVPGGVYRLTFAMAGNPEGPPTIKIMGVSADNQFAEFTFDITGRTIRTMGWTLQSWTFTAIDTLSTIEFFSLDPQVGLYGPALDKVSIARVN